MKQWLLSRRSAVTISVLSLLLRSLAMDLLVAGQVLSGCRRLPEGDPTKEGRVSAMTRKRQEALAWDDMFHERSRSICRMFQAATRRIVELWRVAKSM